MKLLNKLIKSEDELNGIRKSCLILKDVKKEIVKYIKPGIKLEEIDKIGEKLIRERGAIPSFLNYYGFPASICTSINSTLVHGIPGDYELKTGDLISLDFGTNLDGFFCDSAITVIVDEKNAKGSSLETKKKLIEASNRALEVAISVATSGNTTGDIGYATEDSARSFGFTVPREYVGHGIGFGVHEAPEVPNYGLPGTGTKLKEGMVICIEPMIIEKNNDLYVNPLDNWSVITKDGGLTSHSEHTIIITKKEAEVLT